MIISHSDMFKLYVEKAYINNLDMLDMLGEVCENLTSITQSQLCLSISNFNCYYKA